jgi:hypothetical protein
MTETTPIKKLHDLPPLVGALNIADRLRGDGRRVPSQALSGLESAPAEDVDSRRVSFLAEPAGLLEPPAPTVPNAAEEYHHD